MESSDPTSTAADVTARTLAYSVEPFDRGWILSIVPERGVRLDHFLDTEEEAHAKALELLAVRRE